MGARHCWPIAIVVVLCLSVNANASPITLPEHMSTDSVLIDFEEYFNGQVFGPTLTIGNAVFTSLTGSLSILDVSHWGVDGRAVSGNALFPGAEPDSAIAIDFVNPVAQFFLGWGDPSFAGNYLRALDASGLLLEEVAVPFSGSGTIAVGVGFTRRHADIARIIVQPNQSLPSGDDYVIDNIRYSTEPVKRVPEPSSLLLVALGLVGFRTRRRMNLRQR